MSCRSCRRSSRSAIARVSLHSSAIAVGIIPVGLLGDRVEARLKRRRTLWLGIGGLAGGSTLLCLAPALPLDQRPAASISACFLMGAPGGLLPTIVPAVLARSRGQGPGIRNQIERRALQKSEQRNSSRASV